MTTQNKSSKAKATTKKSTSSITDKELANILTETLNKVAETEPKATQPQPVKIDVPIQTSPWDGATHLPTRTWSSIS